MLARLILQTHIFFLIWNSKHAALLFLLHQFVVFIFKKFPPTRQIFCVYLRLTGPPRISWTDSFRQLVSLFYGNAFCLSLELRDQCHSEIFTCHNSLPCCSARDLHHFTPPLLILEDFWIHVLSCAAFRKKSSVFLLSDF
jgi:hypothetical protein